MSFAYDLAVTGGGGGLILQVFRCYSIYFCTVVKLEAFAHARHSKYQTMCVHATHHVP